MKPNYLLTLVGTIAVTILSCQKTEVTAEKPTAMLSVRQTTTTTECYESCTYTLGYWKNHPEEWPISSFNLGNIVYTKEELLAILKEPVRGNGLISLAHQLIAIRLNSIKGGYCEDLIFAEVAGDDFIIMQTEDDERIPPIGTAYASPADANTLVEGLTALNEGKVGPGSCK